MMNKNLIDDLTTQEIVGLKEYRKKTTIKAIQIRHPFVVTAIEGVVHGIKGDWLAIGIKGERYIIDDDVFKKMYELIEEPNEYGDIMIGTCDYCGKEAYVKAFPYVVKGLCPECYETHKYVSSKS